MNYRCPVCEGRMNRWRFPAIRKHDNYGRQLVIYKCIDCGEEQLYPDE